MIFLFLALLIGGISARVSLMIARSPDLRLVEASKSTFVSSIGLLSALFGVVVFGLSFTLFEWWLPIAGFIIGFWIIAPLLVNRANFEFFYNMRLTLSVLGTGCWLGVLAIFLGLW